jgi:ATP-dependent exoDNAse (exonuclease V) beta subunit
MTRAIDRLIVSGSIDPERGGDESTPIGWVLGRLEATELEGAAGAPVEIDRDGAKLVLRVDRFAPHAPQPVSAADDESQLALFTVENGSVSIAEAPILPELVQVPAPPENRVRRLSYSALALFEMCSYRFYAERIVGLREARPMLGDGGGGMAATEIGDAAHVILEGLDLADPRPPEDMAATVRSRYATATDEEVERIGALVTAYCDSEIAHRLTGLPGATVERSFGFEHDGVLLKGRLDVYHEADGKALVVDYKTNVLEDASPGEVVEREYRLQRLVYALAALRAGAHEVEVVYQFLERPNELVTACYKAEEVPALEAELSEAIARIQAGEFRPTPSDFACSTCPALNLVCAGPNLRGA